MVKSQSTFVRADRIVELDAIAFVCANFSAIVFPTYSKNDSAIRLGHAFEYLIFNIDGIFIDERDNGCGNFFYGLMKLSFAWISLDQTTHKVF